MAVGRLDNLVIFVKGGAPGDVADVKIVGRQKKFLIGEILQLHEQSELRTAPTCQHFGVCGGCKWQHLQYEAQLKHKEKHVRNNLEKISGLSLPEFSPIMASKDQFFYRNKLEYTFSNKRWLTKEEITEDHIASKNALGFHIPKMFDKILDIEKCHLQADPSNHIRLALKDFAEDKALTFYDIREQHGLLRNLIIRTTSTGEVMVIVQFGENDAQAIKLVLDLLKKKFPEITALMYIVNQKKNETFYDLPVNTYHGQSFITEKMGDLSFRIGPKSFYQTNSLQAHELYKKVLEYAQLTGRDVVYDLYTGTGTIANFVAKHSKKVVGIESVADAVEDAMENSRLNGISNTSFHAGDMKDMLTDDFVRKHGRPELVITDPPRAGMHKNVVQALINLKPSRIVYVSCNPATQARDLELLGQVYDVKKIQPVDMFPHTHHVECVVSLELRKSMRNFLSNLQN